MSLFDDELDLGNADPNPISTQPTSRLARNPAAANRLKLTSQAENTLKIPRWAWFVIVGLFVLLVVAAILIPLFLIKNSNQSPAAPSASTPAGSPPLNFPQVPLAAIEAQNAVPPMDGLVKSAVQITQATIGQAGFILVGKGSKTGFYVTDLVSGGISAPVILVSSNTFSSWANAYGQEITYSEKFPTEDVWYNCMSQVSTGLAPCSTISWPAENQLDHSNFATTLWSNVTNNLMFSFLANPNGDTTLTVQDGVSAISYASMEQIIPSLTTPLDSNILTTFYSFNQQYVTFGVVQRFTNTIYYITHFNTQEQPLQKVALSDVGETVLFASTTNDALWLIILTSSRLLLYNRNVDAGNLDFQLTDSFVLDTMEFSPSVCAIDRTYDETSTSGNFRVWCAIGTEESASVIIAFDYTGQFINSSGYLVPTKAMENTSGPMAVQLMLDQKSLFMVSSDTSGNTENTIINISQL